MQGLESRMLRSLTRSRPLPRALALGGRRLVHFYPSFSGGMRGRQ